MRIENIIELICAIVLIKLAERHITIDSDPHFVKILVGHFHST